MKINLKVRFKNPMFYVQILLALLLPVLAYTGMTPQDLTTWTKLGDVLLGTITNPYLVAITAWSIYNAIVDPTTSGFGDSKQALKYDKPKKKGLY